MISLNPVEVLAQFAVLSGLGKHARENQAFCIWASAEIESRERSGCGPESSAALTAAAAALAFYRYTLAQSAQGSNSFEAGDLRVTPGKKSISSAKKLWEEAAAAASPFLFDEGFLFRRANP